MKIKTKNLLIIGICILCSVHVLRGQSSNSTNGGFMSQFNSWISRLRGNNNSNNNNNNNNNSSDKEKESEKSTTGQQMRPVQYVPSNVMPYPIMTSMYGPMSPMTIPFAPRPMPSAVFSPAMPFGSLASGSNIGPNMGPSITLGSPTSLSSGMPPNMGSPMGSSLASGMSSSLGSAMGQSLGSNYPQLSQLSGMRPSYSSASHMMPVHHDYHDSSNDYPVSGYGMGNQFGSSGYNGINSNNYGSLGGGHSAEPQMGDNAYNGEQVEPNNGEEYSSSYQR